jgi:hypothetical protein
LLLNCNLRSRRKLTNVYDAPHPVLVSLNLVGEES